MCRSVVCQGGVHPALLMPKSLQVFLLSSIYLFRLRSEEQSESATSAEDEFSRPESMAEPLIEKQDWH